MAEAIAFLSKKNKERSKEDERPKDAWMITFSDMLMLLITFFVLLISMSSMDQKVFREMFMVFEGGGLGALNLSAKGRVLQPRLIPNIIPSNIDLDTFKNILRLQQAQTKEKEEIGEIVLSLLASGVEVIKRGRDFSIALSDEALFDPGSPVIKPELKPVLDRIGEILSISLNRIVVEGHTDDTPMRGRFLHSNWELSAARASSVMRFFLEQGIISADRIEAKGFAFYRPRVKNISEYYRKRNRRIEIVIKQFEKESF